MSRIITGIDLGSGTLKAAVALVMRGGRPRLLALENILSSGIDSGNIVDFDAACSDISQILKKLEKKTRRKIKTVSVAIGGSGIDAVEASGMLGLSKWPRQVCRRDIDKCIKMARKIRLSEDRQIIQETVHSFYINEWEEVKSPINLFATKLGLKLYIITAEIAKVKNVYNCIEHTGRILENIIFSPSAISESILTQNSTGTSTLILDIGSHVTNISLFGGSCLKYTRTLCKEADSLISPDDVLLFLNEVKNCIAGKQFMEVFIAGGGSLKENIFEFAEKVLKVKCDVGRVKLKWCGLKPSDALIHTSSLGIIEHKVKQLVAYNKIGNPFLKASKFVNNVLENYF